MSAEEDDPDTLQLLDELDEEWVNRWRKKVSGDSSRGDELTFAVLLSEKVKSAKRKTL